MLNASSSPTPKSRTGKSQKSLWPNSSPPSPTSTGARWLEKRMLTEDSTTMPSSSSTRDSNEAWPPSTSEVSIQTSKSSRMEPEISSGCDTTSEKATIQVIPSRRTRKNPAPTRINPSDVATFPSTLRRQNASIGETSLTLPRTPKRSWNSSDTTDQPTSSSDTTTSKRSRSSTTTRRQTTSRRTKTTPGSLLPNWMNGLKMFSGRSVCGPYLRCGDHARETNPLTGVPLN